MTVTDESNLETGLYSALDFMLDNSIETPLARIIVSTLQFNSDESDLCDDNSQLLQTLVTNQIHHVLFHFDSAESNLTVDVASLINDTTFNCFMKDDDLDGTTTESYFQYDISQIEQSNNVSNGIQSMINNVWTVYWTNSLLFQQTAAKKLGAFTSAGAYGQVGNDLWYVA